MPRVSFAAHLRKPTKAPIVRRPKINPHIGKRVQAAPSPNGIEQPKGTKAAPSEKLFTFENARHSFEELSRSPFKDFLALLISNHPTPENLQSFANQHPDKWAQAVQAFARTSGYTDQLEVKHTIYSAVLHMSDMDLEHQMRSLTRDIGSSYLVDPATIIDITEPAPLANSPNGATERVVPNLRPSKT